MAGDTKESVAIQTTSIIKSIETEEREKILTNFTKTLPISSEHLAAMKGTLNLPWNQTRTLHRWLRTFNIKISSEKNTRGS